MSLFFELTEFLCTMPSSGRMGLCFCGACINPALFHAPTGGSILEATVGENQGRATSHYGNEASLPSQFHHPHVRTEAFFDCVQSGPPPNLPTHDWDSETVLEARPHGSGGYVTTQGTAQDGGSGNTNRTAVRRRPTCTDCKREFARVQEFKRHLKDKHEPRRQCPFCNLRWTRPNVIKVHLLAKHRRNFTAELLVTIQALRGQGMVAFLDGYDRGSNVEASIQDYNKVIVTPPRATPSQMP